MSKEEQRRISHETFSYFCVHYYKNEYDKKLRFGQSFCNHFMITDDVLYYEADIKKVNSIIMEKYIETDGCEFCGACNLREYEVNCTGECK